MRQAHGETPLYIRAGSLIAMQVGERSNNQNHLSNIELHVFCPPGSNASFDYSFDDATAARISVASNRACASRPTPRASSCACRRAAKNEATAPCGLRFVLHAPLETVVYDNGTEQRLPLRDAKQRLTGEPLSVLVSGGGDDRLVTIAA